MTNVISADSSSDKHYKHNAFSSTITDSYSSPANTPYGITWDGSNVISADYFVDKHFKHSGFSSTITDSYASPSTEPLGITWDGSNVISSTYSVDKHFKHSGFSSTITDSYASPSTEPLGITWDGSNVISSTYSVDKHFKHSGFSSTITDSYASPSTEPEGITWDGTNVISADSSSDKHYKHTGFSASISDSYSAPFSKPTGITWDGRYGAAEKTSSDTGTGVDAWSLSCSISESDVGAGVDTLYGSLSDLSESDVGAGVDTVSESLSSRLETDIGAGVDALIELLKFVAKFGSDVGIGVDARLSLLAELAQSETGIGAEALGSRVFGSCDLGIGVDARLSLLAELAQSETGIGAEALTSRVFGFCDLGIGVDYLKEIVDILSEEGVSIEFANFTEDFQRLLSRYGRTMLNHRTKTRFQTVLNVLTGSMCLGDKRQMGCGDAIAYVLPTFTYALGDKITPVLGRGEWTIVAERRASRIGNLRIFRTLGLERYTPGSELTGKYTIAVPLLVELESSYNIGETLINLEVGSLYNIVETPAQIVGERAVASGDMINNYWNPWNDDALMYYKVHRSVNTGFTPSDANLVGVPGTNSFGHMNLSVPTTFYFRVCAVTKLGISGEYSAQFSATTSA